MEDLDLVMKDLENVLSQQKEKIEFHCSACKKNHTFYVSKDLFETDTFPIPYAYVHGDPQVIAMVYIDKDLQVRGTEYPKGIGMNLDQLNRIINTAKSYTLKPIPLQSIYLFRLIQNNEIKKMYAKKGYGEIIDFDAILEIVHHTKNISANQESCREIFIKFNDFWVGGMELLDFQFFMVVSSEVDIDHFKYQMMSLFEIFSSNYSTEEV